ncbi:hypothetical protein J7384_16230 [Endozoicomonas sp. G2_1]|uniref:hypothetical protein n=1 Tax=Endozoicomonas sp. G2_1 TaxID=2821091 RepID=UPI001ADA5255|nr:hypothetical protein [Endozoicomonas sp. G2_1]MBO9491909.1 hypothetical protein [Endozoicomonas sp. G2_1]
MSTETIAIIIVVVIILFLIGNFSTVQKSAKNPMRKQGLNDLKETLPRTNKTKHQLPTVDKKR